MKFRESDLAHFYCRGSGLEIGGSAHNSFGLKTRNVDITKEMTIFKKEEVNLCGEYMPVDIEAPGDKIPLPDASEDFVVSSHVIEHFTDPMGALLEWYRIIKKGGIIFIIVPHKERTFDKDRPRTTLQELIDRHAGIITLDPSLQAHFSVWITGDFVEMIKYMNNEGLFPEPVTIEAVRDFDDKVGNGFTVVIRKQMTRDTDSQYKASVCLASYNGEKFIRKQIESILSDLIPFDELIICDDGSTDRTCSIIESFNDTRITLIHNEKNLGYVRNFEKLISLATGDFIFLSDQDNIWIKGKVQKVISAFQEDNRIRLVCHSFRPIDASGNDFKMNVPLCREGEKNSFIILVSQFIKSRFHGCTFCLNRRAVRDLLPFPSSTYSHDHWILVWAAINGYVFFLDEALIEYRRHGFNISPLKPFPFRTILLLRYKLLLQICTSAYRRWHHAWQSLSAT